MSKLPENLAKALLAYDDPLAVFTWAGGDDADLVAKVDAQDIEGFRGAPVRYQWELGRFDAGPVLCCYLEILDDPANPYGLETFLDLAKEDGLALARRLIDQDHLTIHFHDMSLGYQFSKRIAHRELQRAELADLVEQALEHLAGVGDKADWYQARQEFMQAVTR